MKIIYLFIFLISFQLHALTEEAYRDLKGYTLVDIVQITEVNPYNDQITLSNGLKFKLDKTCPFCQMDDRVVIFSKHYSKEEIEAFNRQAEQTNDEVMDACDLLNRTLMREGFPEPVVYKVYPTREKKAYGTYKTCEVKLILADTVFNATLLTSP